MVYVTGFFLEWEIFWKKFVEQIKTHCSHSAWNKQSKTLYLLHIHALMFTILRKNPTNTLTYHFIHTVTLLHVSTLKGPSTGSTDTFFEKCQQNMCPDVNIKIWSSMLCVYNCHITHNTLLFSLIFTSGHIFCWHFSLNVSTPCGWPLEGWNM